MNSVSSKIILVGIAITVIFFISFMLLYKNSKNSSSPASLTINELEFCDPKNYEYSLCCEEKYLGRSNIKKSCGKINADVGYGTIDIVGRLDYIKWLNPHVKNFIKEQSTCKCNFWSKCNTYIKRTKCDTIEYKSWMTTYWDTLNFDKKWLSNIVIPGTHDSLAYGSSSYISSAQSMSIEKQLKDGIRYFDFRFRYSQDTNDYQAHHGLSPFPVFLLNNKQVPIPGTSKMDNGLSVKNALSNYISIPGSDKELFVLEWRLDGMLTTPQDKIIKFWNDVKNIFPENNILTQYDLSKLMNVENSNFNGNCENLPDITGANIAMLPIKSVFELKKGPVFINFAHGYSSIPCEIKNYFYKYDDGEQGTIFNTYANFVTVENRPTEMLELYTKDYYTNKINITDPKVNILAITQSSGNIVKSLFDTATIITPVLSDFLLYKGPNSDPDNVPGAINNINVFGPANNYGTPLSKSGNPLYNYNIITTNYYELCPFVENIIRLNKLNETFMVG